MKFTYKRFKNGFEKAKQQQKGVANPHKREEFVLIGIRTLKGLYCLQPTKNACIKVFRSIGHLIQGFGLRI